MFKVHKFFNSLLVLSITFFLISCGSGNSEKTNNTNTPILTDISRLTTPESSNQQVFIVSNNYRDNKINIFKQSGNQLIYTHEIATGFGPLQTVITTNQTGQKFAYTLNYNSQTISMYHIESDGNFIALSPPQIRLPADFQFNYIAAEQYNGTYLYATSYTGNYIAQFEINLNGSLSVSPRFLNIPNPVSMAFSPDGTDYMVSGNKPSQLYIYSPCTNSSQIYNSPNSLMMNEESVELQGNAQVLLDPKGWYIINLNTENSSFYLINRQNPGIRTQFIVGSTPIAITTMSSTNPDIAFIYVLGDDYALRLYYLRYPISELLPPTITFKSMLGILNIHGGPVTMNSSSHNVTISSPGGIFILNPDLASGDIIFYEELALPAPQIPDAVQFEIDDDNSKGG